MLEAEIQRDILLAAATVRCRLLRNNVGMLKDRNDKAIRYGVGGPGGSDLIGWTDINGMAVFTAIEVKRPGKHPTELQLSFISAIKRQGGIAAICYSVEDFKQVVNEYRDAHATGAPLTESGRMGKGVSRG